MPEIVPNPLVAINNAREEAREDNLRRPPHVYTRPTPAPQGKGKKKKSFGRRIKAGRQ
jgi:hypothetical protein